MRLPGLIVILFALLSCRKDDEGRIPDVYVNYKVSIQEFNLKNTDGVFLAEGGVAGILLYRRPDNNYVAFDRCSSVDPDKRCVITPDSPSLTATDPCSGAKFSLYDGTPMKAPAKKPLKQYQVNLSSFEIYVTN